MTGMPLAEVLAPAVPAVLYALLTLASAIIFVVCLGLLWSWKRTIGYVLSKIAGVSIFGGHPLGFVGHLNDEVVGFLSEQAAACENAMVYRYHQTISKTIWAAQELSGLATDTYDAINRLQFYWTPWFLGVKLKPIADKIDLLDKSDADLRSHSQPNARAHTKTVAHKTVYVTTKVTKIVHTKAVANTAVAGGTLVKPREWKQAKADIKKLKWYIAFGGMVAFGNFFLKRFSLSWLKCPALLRMGNRFGCAGFSFLESLLALSFEAWLITDLCTIVSAMTKAARLFASELEYLSGQIAGLIQCQGASRPDPLSVAWYEPAPVVESLQL